VQLESFQEDFPAHFHRGMEEWEAKVLRTRREQGARLRDRLSGLAEVDPVCLRTFGEMEDFSRAGGSSCGPAARAVRGGGADGSTGRAEATGDGGWRRNVRREGAIPGGPGGKEKDGRTGRSGGRERTGAGRPRDVCRKNVVCTFFVTHDGKRRSPRKDGVMVQGVTMRKGGDDRLEEKKQGE